MRYLSSRSPTNLFRSTKSFWGSGFSLSIAPRQREHSPHCSSRLPIICEARDDDGQWRLIEALVMELSAGTPPPPPPPGRPLRQFAAPTYSGTTKTKLRFKLEIKQPILTANGSPRLR